MRSLVFLLFFFISSALSAQIVTQFPYIEDFENGSGNWSSPSINGVWQFGQPSTTQLNGAFSGTNAWCTILNGNYPNNVLQSITTPLFNFGALSEAPYLRFKYNMATESCCDVLRLQYSLDDQNWVTVGNFNTGQNWYNDSTVDYWSGNSGGWKIASHRLDDLPQDQNIRFRFRFFTDFNQTDEGFAIDDVEIVSNYTDIELKEIISPVQSACTLPSNTDVSVSLQNLGQNTVNSISLNYQIGNGSIVSETLATLDTAVLVNYTFNQKADFSSDGNYDLKVWISAPGDNQTVNDTLFQRVVNLPEINQFPYLEDFESGMSEWTASGENSTWSLGNPLKKTIRGAASDTTAWTTGSLGFGEYNNNETSSVLSPCFNTNSLTNSQLRLSVWWESESDYDGANIQYSIDDGQTWITLDDANALNWYNNSQVIGLGFTGSQSGWSGNATFNNGSEGYQNAVLNNNQLSSRSSLRFRVNFGSDLSTRDDGFAFDDFRLLEAVNTDLSMDRNNKSYFELCQGDSDSLWAYFSNYGTVALDSFTLQFWAGNQFGSVQYPGSLSVGSSDSLFLGIINATDTGDFEVRVYSDLVVDGFPFNDTSVSTLNIYSIKAPAQSNNVEVCDSSRALLTAQGRGLSKWYSDAARTNLVFVGDTFLTGSITSDSTFYLSNTIGTYDTIGPVTNGFGSGSYAGINSRTIIEITEYTTIAEARYYAIGSGDYTITIEGQDGREIDSRVIDVQSTGASIAYLGFDLLPGMYTLRVHDFNNVTLFRNTDNADYESYSNDHVAIIGNTFDPAFYYYLYEIKVVKSEPCAGESSVQVTRGSIIPTANFSFNQVKNRFRLFNTSQAGESFTWIFENTNTGLVDSTNDVSPEVFLDTGVYNVSLIARNDCGTDTLTRSFQIDQISAVEIEKIAVNNELKVYPIPASDILNWQLEIDEAVEQLAIHNALGECVLRSSEYTNGSIDISSLESGYYIFVIISESGQYRKTFIVR